MPCAVRVTKGPSTSELTDTEEEASHDETSNHNESEPEQDLFINHPHPNAPHPVYTNMYMPCIKGQKLIGWSMMHYTTDSPSGTSNARIFYNVSLLPCLNARSVRKLMCGLATLEWISMYPGGYPKKK